MAANCAVDPALKEKFKKFNRRKEKNNAAIIMKIDPSKFLVEEDSSLEEELADYDDITIDELASILPAHQPRYFVYSYVLKHADGRVSYPQCFVYVSPIGAKPELSMMYAGSKLSTVNELGCTKVYETRSVDDLTEDWLKSKLL